MKDNKLKDLLDELCPKQKAVFGILLIILIMKNMGYASSHPSAGLYPF